ncbi:MAG: hypothetical protein WBS19_20425 [Candidatus Korobacteraceae bacterium]
MKPPSLCGLIASLVLVAAVSAAGQTVQTTAVNVAAVLGKDGNGFCTQTVAGNPIQFVTLSETNGDEITYTAAAPYASATINFPVGTAAFPGTPFWSDSLGQWMRQQGSGSASPPVTLTAQEQVGRSFRFPYSSITFNDGSSCTMPVGGMGVQVTK